VNFSIYFKLLRLLLVINSSTIIVIVATYFSVSVAYWLWWVLILAIFPDVY